MVDGLLGSLVALRPALLRYLKLRGATNEEAEDVIQEAALRLSEAKTGPVDQTKAYLYRVAHNEFLTLRRAGVRRKTREKDWVDSTTGDFPEIDQHASAEASLIDRERLAVVQATLNDLPDRTRSIFKRFRMDRTSQKTIAADLGISLSAVEKHLARAYEALTRAKIRLDEESLSPRHLIKSGDGDAL